MGMEMKATPVNKFLKLLAELLEMRTHSSPAPLTASEFRIN